MSSWDYQRQLRVQRSRAMYAMALRALRWLRRSWRFSRRVAWQLREVG